MDYVPKQTLPLPFGTRRSRQCNLPGPFAICGLAPICWRIHVPVIPPCPDELGAAQVALLLSCFTQSRLKAFFSPVPARFLRLGTLFDRRAILFDLGTVASWERLAVLR